MRRIEQVFKDLKKSNKKALIPFITAGDLCFSEAGVSTAEVMHALVDGGADIIELGVPFSDPAADGEVIQHSSQRAIKNGTNYDSVINDVKEFRKNDTNTPVLLMGYLNIAEVQPDGFNGYCQQAKQAGADAMILVDLSFESGAVYRDCIDANEIDLISLIAPTTQADRMKAITKNSTGFIYYVSSRGITGSGKGLDTTEIKNVVAKIKENTETPVCIGFGISNGEIAKQMADLSDGVVVGSALVKKLYNASQNKENVLEVAIAFITELRKAIDS